MKIKVNKLLKEAMAATGAKTYSECVDMALRANLRVCDEERKRKKLAKKATKLAKLIAEGVIAG